MSTSTVSISANGSASGFISGIDAKGRNEGNAIVVGFNVSYPESGGYPTNKFLGVSNVNSTKANIDSYFASNGNRSHCESSVWIKFYGDDEIEPFASQENPSNYSFSLTSAQKSQYSTVRVVVFCANNNGNGIHSEGTYNEPMSSENRVDPSITGTITLKENIDVTYDSSELDTLTCDGTTITKLTFDGTTIF